MPAPTSSSLKSAILANVVPPDFPSQTQELKDFIQAVADAISTAWGSWQSGLTGGANSVNGAGTGAWSGSGAGGVLTESTLMEPTIVPPFPSTTPEMQQLIDATNAEFKQQFSAYASSFTFATVSYIGTSTATPPPPSAPGVFTATNTTAPIGSLKASATMPSAIATGIKGRLSDPFDFNSGASKLPQLLTAIETAVLQAFSTWETSSSFSGDTVTGSAAGGTGIGSGTSAGTGTIS